MFLLIMKRKKSGRGKSTRNQRNIMIIYALTFIRTKHKSSKAEEKVYKKGINTLFDANFIDKIIWINEIGNKS